MKSHIENLYSESRTKLPKNEFILFIKDIAKVLQIHPNSISLQSNIFGELGSDSLQFLDLLLEARKTFNINIKPYNRYIITIYHLIKYSDNAYQEKYNI